MTIQFSLRAPYPLAQIFHRRAHRVVSGPTHAHVYFAWGAKSSVGREAAFLTAKEAAK